VPADAQTDAPEVGVEDEPLAAAAVVAAGGAPQAGVSVTVTVADAGAFPCTAAAVVEVPVAPPAAFPPAAATLGLAPAARTLTQRLSLRQ